MPPAPNDPFPRLPVRARAVAFATGLVLALATSGGIAEERVTLGAPGVAVAVNAATTLAALAAVVIMMRRTRVFFVTPRPQEARAARHYALAVLVPQLVGCFAGVAIVHAALRHEAAATLPWLSERPAQLVNDVVAVSGFLALVWACADGLDVRLLVAVLVVVTAYRMTAPLWHVDRAPGELHNTVQQLVAAQLVAAAFALGLFRAAVQRSTR